MIVWKQYTSSISNFYKFDLFLVMWMYSMTLWWCWLPVIPSQLCHQREITSSPSGLLASDCLPPSQTSSTHRKLSQSCQPTLGSGDQTCMCILLVEICPAAPCTTSYNKEFPSVAQQTFGDLGFCCVPACLYRTPWPLTPEGPCSFLPSSLCRCPRSLLNPLPAAF